MTNQSHKVKFSELSAKNKAIAISHMLYLKNKHHLPTGINWDTKDDIHRDLGQYYNPNDHFAFYLNEYNELDTKIEMEKEEIKDYIITQDMQGFDPLSANRLSGSNLH